MDRQEEQRPSASAPAARGGQAEAAATGARTAGGLATRLLRSSGAATFSQVWRFGVTLAVHLVVRRIVSPEQWGLWHWSVDLLFLLLAQVRDLGLPPHVVRDASRPYGNFLALELAWGGVLALGVFFASPLLALAYSEPSPEAVAVIRALCLFLILEGLARVPLTYFEAELLIERALAPELVRNFCFAALAVGLAVAGYGIWSLVVAHVVATGVFAAFLWMRAVPGMPLRWVPGETFRLVRIGIPLMAMAFLLLAVDFVDLQVLSLRFPAEVIGRYGAVLFFALLMPRVLELPVRRALYPGFVAVRNDPHRFFETYRLATLLLMAVQVPYALFLFVNAETMLVLYGGGAYAPAAPWLRVLCFIPLVQPFARCAEDVILTRHEERLLIVATSATLASLVGFGLWFTAVAGPVGMAWAKLLPVGAILVTWAVYRIDPPAFRRLGADLALLYLVPVPLFAAAWSLGPDRPWLRLGLSMAAGLASVGLYTWRWGRDFRRFFRDGAA